MLKLYGLTLMGLLLSHVGLCQKAYTLASPDGQLILNISVGKTIQYSLRHQADDVLAPSPISMQLSSGETWGKDPKVIRAKTDAVHQLIKAPFYKRSSIKDDYNELALTFAGDYGLTFRAYNDGAAYRFMTTRRQPFQIQHEEVAFHFAADLSAIVPYVKVDSVRSADQQFANSFENLYTQAPLSKLDPKRLAFLPIVVNLPGHKKLCLTEVDLENYPGLYLQNRAGGQTLTGVFAPYPKQWKQGGYHNLEKLVTEREPYIAQVDGPRAFPWRAMVVTTQDRQLTDNDLVYKLAAPARVADLSWIRPGKVAWDWWNDWNLYGVDFRAGINTRTYQHYIDFAAAHGIEYVLLDEGWSVLGKADLMQVVPDIDLKQLVAYGRQKNVGIVLWAGYAALDRDVEGLCKHYSELGIKGFKVDFIDRDDQEAVRFLYKAAATGARYHLFMDFHGIYKPTGLLRTYPNVLNTEGVHGLESVKWIPGSVDMVTYDVTIPFIRMVAGPMDYTQGAMHNATRNTYRASNSSPMSQGTRCRQLAEYIVFEGPFSMLCDSPSNYDGEPLCRDFIANIPTTWDQTMALDGQLAEYVTLARQKGNTWYVGGMTNWTARDLTLDLSFLGEGAYTVELFRDGINADRAAQDFRHESLSLPADKRLRIRLAPGGGFAARITPVQP